MRVRAIACKAWSLIHGMEGQNGHVWAAQSPQHPGTISIPRSQPGLLDSLPILSSVPLLTSEVCHFYPTTLPFLRWWDSWRKVVCSLGDQEQQTSALRALDRLSQGGTLGCRRQVLGWQSPARPTPRRWDTQPPPTLGCTLRYHLPFLSLSFFYF